jgi:catechol 2,3-dioxygenase-like lactoylglutathione lyase family enzyme
MVRELSAILLALICLPSPLHAQDKPLVAVPSFGFVGLDVADIEAAKRFYIDGVGMRQALVLSKPTDPFQKIALNFTGDPRSAGTLLILIHYDKLKAPKTRPPGGMVGMFVSDTHAAAARLRSHGYPVLREPSSTDKGPVLTSLTRDPDGLLVELSEYRGTQEP